LLVGAGIGWILGGVLWRVLRNYEMQSDYGETFVATTALCAGIALIIVYLIERKAHKEAKKEE
jgi:hypothetical protein